jgi:hypothetical protein
MDVIGLTWEALACFYPLFTDLKKTKLEFYICGIRCSKMYLVVSNEAFAMQTP